MGRTLVTSKRVPAVLGAVAMLATVAMPNALASGTGTGTAVHSGWWWAAQLSSATPLPVPYATQPGELVVSRHGGVQEKAAAVWLDLDDLHAPPRALVVKLDEINVTDAASVPAGLIACPIVSGPWEPMQGGTWSTRPVADCSGTDVAIGQRFDDDRSWAFDLTAMAKSWTAGGLANRGFEIIPARSLRYPSFELSLRAPLRDDVHLLPGGAPRPQPVPLRATTPLRPNPAAGSSEPPPSNATPQHTAGDWKAPPGLAHPAVASGRAGAPSAGSTRATRAEAAAADEQVALAGSVVHDPIDSSTTPTELLLLFGVTCAGAGLVWWRARASARPTE